MKHGSIKAMHRLQMLYSLYANMLILKHSICLMALFAVISLTLGQASQGGPHTSQGGPHQNQGRIKRQAEQDGPEENDVTVNWTTCDLTVTPKYSCQDCNGRLICLPIGGKVISCPSVLPYCVDGYCSAVPSAECS